MDEFEVVLTEEAQTDILKLTPRLQERVINKLGWMGANVAFLRHQSLSGKKWAETFKYRMGDYRIIYQLNHEQSTLVVLKVGHRRDVYRL